MKILIYKKPAFTLVELLVAIAILTIVTALIIPRLRVVNKDRNIRETARVIGSAFSSARERAIAEGTGGVIIQRNPNFSVMTSDGNRVLYAGTRLFQTRAIPPYAGDVDGDTAMITTVSNELEVTLDTPFEPGVINQNDTISFGGFSARYRINSEPMVDTADPTMMTFFIAWDDDPTEAKLDTDGIDFLTGTVAPELDNDLSFVVYRQPIKVESSVVDLPPGYIIDLRYSGPADPGTFEPNHLSSTSDDPDTFTAFGLAIDANADLALPANNEVRITFNGQGALERAIFNNEDVIINQSLFFYVSEFDPNIPTSSAQAAADALLTIPENLWMTIGTNGGANIGYNAPPTPGGNIADMIANARTISRTSTSANQ